MRISHQTLPTIVYNFPFYMMFLRDLHAVFEERNVPREKSREIA